MAEGPSDDVLPMMDRLQKLIHPFNLKAEPTLASPSLAQLVTPNRRPVLARVDYGVITRNNETFNLEYFAKAVERPVDAQLKVGHGFELTAHIVGDNWEVEAFLDGRPEAISQINVGVGGSAIRKNAEGKILIPLTPTAAAIPIRATREIKRTGTLDGKTFESTHQWTTLVLPATAAVSTGSDPLAYRALQFAGEWRESLTADAQPFRVKFSATNTNQTLTGTVTWRPNDLQITFDGPEGEATKHVRTQLSSLFQHRVHRSFEQGEGKYRITLKGTKENALSIALNDPMKSSYVIKDGRLAEVKRVFGKEELTLNIHKFQETPNGRYLSTGFHSVSRDVATGEVRAELDYEDAFNPIDGVWLPKSRTVKGKTNGHRIEMRVTFSDYSFLTN